MRYSLSCGLTYESGTAVAKPRNSLSIRAAAFSARLFQREFSRCSPRNISQFSVGQFGDPLRDAEMQRAQIPKGGWTRTSEHSARHFLLGRDGPSADHAIAITSRLCPGAPTSSPTTLPSNNRAIGERRRKSTHLGICFLFPTRIVRTEARPVPFRAVVGDQSRLDIYCG